MSVSGARGADEPAAAIRLDRVSKAFGAFRVLDDVTLGIPSGRATVVLGRSGTGKSVMLRHIVGLLQPLDLIGTSHTCLKVPSDERAFPCRQFFVNIS